ncbi:MAG TPA: AraC family transcriptional regulator [Puia sp.]|nr:AraC family transcriptional regulator [Puia sp.]
MKYNTLHRVISLNAQDCLTYFSSVKNELNRPLHYHAEYELLLILDGAGARRVVGNQEATLSDLELVFLGPNLPHSWKSPGGAGDSQGDSGRPVTEISIMFPGDLLPEEFLGKNQLSQINQLFFKASFGVSFSTTTIKNIYPKLVAQKEKKGFASFLGLLSILHDLSVASDSQVLSTEVTVPELYSPGNQRIDSVYAYMKANYSRSITLDEMAKRACMSKGAFCRFLRQRTGKSYMESLNEIRIGHISRMLVGTSEDIAEIAYKAGYNNVAHFNRSFKRQKGCTPKAFRESYSGKKDFAKAS